jgi:endonuclease/exonuclease/phosphatase family metal-dependent hydrolase
MTFNIRYEDDADGANAWRYRRDLVIGTIRDCAPDLLGLQEPTASQWNELEASLTDYAPFGLTTNESGETDPYGGFYRIDRYVLLDRGLFWLSDTPDVAQSISWANDWGARACAWTRLRDRANDRELVFASTHVDTNRQGWLPSAHVLADQLELISRGLPVVLAGDFNCPAGAAAHLYLTSAAGFKDTWSEAGHLDSGVITYHAFTGAPSLAALGERARHLDDGVRAGNYRIDWILIRGALTCGESRINLYSVYRAAGTWPSDHYPVTASIGWAQE